MTSDGQSTTISPASPFVRRAGLLLAGGLAVVGLLGGCSGGSDKSSDKGGVNTVASTQSPATFAGGSPTVPPDSDTPSSTVPTTAANPDLPGDPLSYAKKLFEDWKSGDQTGAGTLATPETVTALFAKTYAETDDWSEASCSGTTEGKGSSAKSTSTCVWTSAEGKLTVVIDNDTLGKPQATVKATFAKA